MCCKLLYLIEYARNNLISDLDLFRVPEAIFNTRALKFDTNVAKGIRSAWIVWVIMGRWGYSQNTTVVVALVGPCDVIYPLSSASLHWHFGYHAIVKEEAPYTLSANISGTIEFIPSAD